MSNVLLDPNAFGNVLEWWYDTDLHTIFTNKLAEGLVVGVDQTLGLIFISAAIGALFYRTGRVVLKWIIYLGILGLVLITFALMYAKNFYVGLFFEHAAQILSPLFLIFAIRKMPLPTFVLWLKITIAIAFICHGLFAIGHYPIPGKFVDMMIYGFGLEEEVAKQILFSLGILDFAFAILIFVPKLAKPALIYGIVWGFLTAMARITTSFDIHFMSNWLSQYLYQFFIRISHFSIPLILWLIATNYITRIPFRQPKTSE
ncbi:MAG: hypothetical protein JKY54_01215 [Flavobacteriales bacterium]|nr:hypothetical protein [Flavobacteriales bacterium]